MTTIHKDPFIKMRLGFVPDRVKYTGTVGLICHLKHKGLFDKNDCGLIKEDLMNSGFRVKSDILRCLD